MLSRAHKLVLGFANWGKAKIPKTESLRTVKFALENGIFEIDCAPHYGDGALEELLAEISLNLQPHLRSMLRVTSKGGRTIDRLKKSSTTNGFTLSSGFAQAFDYSKVGIQTAFNQSLSRLGVDHVHAYYLHDMDIGTHKANYETHYQDFMRDGHLAFHELKEQKRIDAIGIGSNDINICIKLINDGRFKIDRIMLAGCYNLLDYSALDKLFPLCKENNIQIYIAAPYGGGILSGQENNTFFKYAEASADILKKVEQIKSLCTDFQVTLPHAAMQFVHKHPQVERVVVGARTVVELETSLKFATQPIVHEFWDALARKELIPPVRNSSNLAHSSLFSQRNVAVPQNHNFHTHAVRTTVLTKS
ncbi:MAG: aldo/keto reductase [Gammaproteobacteria bacterium]